MSLLSYNELCALIDQGVIENSSYDLVNSASIDIRLGRYVLQEQQPSHSFGTISINKKQSLPMKKIDLRDRDYVLFPREFILAQSLEKFNLPANISAEYKLKSSMARIGLEHFNAGWCDAGWNGSVLTLELVNLTQFHNIVLHEGDKIGQIVFFRHEEVPSDKSYASRGRYNKDTEVSGAKG
jgi:dCTP deaminase